MTTSQDIIAILKQAVQVGSTAVQFGKDAAPVAELIYNTFVKGGGSLALDAVSPALGSAFQIGSALIQVGIDLAPVATMLYDTLVLKKDVSQDELDAFAAETDRLGEQLMAPLPAPEAGETN